MTTIRSYFYGVARKALALSLLIATSLLSSPASFAGGVVTAEIVSAPTSACPGSLSSVQVRIRFDGDDNDGPWQVLTIALRDDDIFPAYNTIRSVSNPFTIPSQGVWYSYTFSSVDLSAYNDGGDGVELYVWAEVNDNDVNGYQPDGRSAIRQVSVGSAPVTPSGSSPANGSTVATQPTILNWADSSGATSYDLYLDGTFRANVTVSQWTLNQTLILGTHNWYVVAKNSCGSIIGPTWSFTIICPNPGTPSSPNPGNNTTVASQPTVLDWADTSGATSYDVYLDGTFRANVSVSQWTLNQTLSLTTHNWYVVAKNGCGSTTGPTWSFTINCPLPGFPNSPTPANGATIIAPPTILNWSDASGATSYDVYLDGSFRGNVSASQWTLNLTIFPGLHSWYVVAKNSCGSSPGPSPVWSFTISCPTPNTPSGPSPANGATVSTQPTILDWADTSEATSYDVYMDGSFRGNVSASQWTLNLTIFPGLHSWYVVAKNGCDSTTGPTWSFTFGSPPGTPSSPSPADGTALTVEPIKLDWANTSGATSYDVYLKLGSGAFNKVGADLPVSEWTPNQSYNENLFSWYIVAKNAVGTTRGPTWSYNLRTSRISGGASRSDFAPTPVFIQRYPAGTTALIDPNLRTWIIIHGRTGSSINPWVTNLAGVIKTTYTNDQILLLDWRDAANAPDNYLDEENWIQPVAIWAADKLVNYGFAGAGLNLIGHSLGGNMTDELAERISGGVNTIVALDPARNGFGNYNPEDSGEIDFRNHSQFSWAFHSSWLGSAMTPTTADEAFIVDTGLSLVLSLEGPNAHSAVQDIFTYMLRHPSGGVSSQFQISRLLAHQLGPWMSNLFTTSFDQGWPYVETPTIGYEGRIYAAAGGLSPLGLVYTNSSRQQVAVPESAEIIPPTFSTFSVSPNAVLLGNAFAISYTVSDLGGSGLNRVVLRRTSGNGSANDPGWQSIQTNTLSGNGPVNRNFTDTPPSAGTYWYGAAAFDNANNSWDERDAGLGPMQVTVTMPTVAAPTISPNGGSHSGSVPITLACSTPQALIYYTIDGSEPTTSSTSYEGPFTLSSSVTVKAKAFRIGYNPSATAIANFTITPTPTRIISLSGDLAFSVVTVGASAQRTLTIANNGNSTLRVSSISYNPTVFSGNWAGTIAAGDSQNVSVTFSPTAETSYSGTVTVNSDKTAGINTRAISGTGTIVPPQYTITASAGSGGGISPSRSITKNAGDSQAFTASPDANHVVDQWLLDGSVVQSGGTGYTLPNIQDNHSVQVTFTFAPTEYTYTINNGTITITGYTGSGGAVTIPSSINGLRVTSIGDSAFQNNSSVTSVAIPNSVTSIGEWAFAYCTSLTSVTIPNSVTSIGSYAFTHCTSLTDVTIPDSVTSIGGYGAFSFCTSLTGVTIGNSVTSIGEQAFMHCTSLTNITIPNSVIIIGSVAFYECTSLTSITIPNSVTSIGNSAFSSCTNLTYVTIPNSVTSIGNSAFSSCTSLTNVTIPNSVTSIGEWAFSSSTSLTSVTIGNSVTSIGNYAFSSCTSLADVTIGNSVTSIGNQAFYSCTSLINVTIPNSVTSIGTVAFYHCTSLTAVYFQGNAPSLGSEVFDGGANATIYYLPGTTGWGPTFGGRPTALWNPTPGLRQLTGMAMSNGLPRFILNGPVGSNYLVQFSSNLVNWLPLSTHTISSGGSISITDPSMRNQSRRFYRAVPQGSADIIIPATSGAVTAPFTITNGSIYQPLQTLGVNGGRAAYDFIIATAGNYVVKGMVNAPNGATNSFFVNINAEPQTPSMIWDIRPFTSGFEQRTVSWVGNGTTNSQFVPKVFNLGQGQHQLIIRGREAGVLLQSLTVSPYP